MEGNHCTKTFTFGKCICKIIFSEDLFLVFCKVIYTLGKRKAFLPHFFLNLNGYLKKNGKHKQFKIYLLCEWQLQLFFFFFATSTLNHTFTLETKEQKMGG